MPLLSAILASSVWNRTKFGSKALGVRHKTFGFCQKSSRSSNSLVGMFLSLAASSVTSACCLALTLPKNSKVTCRLWLATGLPQSATCLQMFAHAERVAGSGHNAKNRRLNQLCSCVGSIESECAVYCRVLQFRFGNNPIYCGVVPRGGVERISSGGRSAGHVIVTLQVRRQAMWCLRLLRIDIPAVSILQLQMHHTYVTSLAGCGNLQESAITKN